MVVLGKTEVGHFGICVKLGHIFAGNMKLGHFGQQNQHFTDLVILGIDMQLINWSFWVQEKYIGHFGIQTENQP